MIDAEFGVMERDHDGPLARLEKIKADPHTPVEAFRLLTEGKTLSDIAEDWRTLTGQFTAWFMDTHAALYDSALRVRADQLAHQALQKADGCTDKDDAPAAKLQVDTRLKLAEKWDRARYGSKDSGGGANITVIVDRSCGGAVEVEAGGVKARVPLASAEASA